MSTLKDFRDERLRKGQIQAARLTRYQPVPADLRRHGDGARQGRVDGVDRRVRGQAAIKTPEP